MQMGNKIEAGVGAVRVSRRFAKKWTEPNTLQEKTALRSGQHVRKISVEDRKKGGGGILAEPMVLARELGWILGRDLG